MSDTKKIRQRNDYPRCPYCGSKVAASVPPNGKVSLYCVADDCKGASTNGVRNGYHINLEDLTTPVDDSRYLFPPTPNA